MDEPLLLHSLTEHRELIFGALDTAKPGRIIEIGSEAGGFSKELLDWTSANGATLATVKPYPTPELRELASTTPHFELVAARSPAALQRIEPAEAYVIDGDHNHWTVLRKLRAAFADRDPAPLAILHDVGWPPCARPDQSTTPPARSWPSTVIPIPTSADATRTARSSSAWGASRCVALRRGARGGWDEQRRAYGG